MGIRVPGGSVARGHYSGVVRELLRPGWIITHVLVAATAIAFISLGLWQVDRHHEQAAENERVGAQLAQAPVPVGQALEAGDRDLLPVTATGTYRVDADVELSPRSRNELPGMEVLTPLDLADGEVLMVNRGWVPLDAPVPAVPTGEVTVEGRLRTPIESRQVLRTDEGVVRLVSNVDLAVLADQVDGLRTDTYLEVVDDVALEAGAIPRPAPPISLDAGPHLSYAFQWFAFTTIGLVGYPLLLRRRIADRRAARADTVRPRTDDPEPAPASK